jgi:hypothetical protein
VPKSQLFGNYEGKLVGTTRFELATSPTPILDLTQSEQLGATYQCVRERESTRHNAYWTRIGPTNGPTLAFAITRHERQPAWHSLALAKTGTLSQFGEFSSEQD